MITSELYLKIVDYCKYRVYIKKVSLNHVDLAHDVICDPLFDADWLRLVDRKIFAFIDYSNIFKPEGTLKSVQEELLIRCKKCDCDYPDRFYRLSKKICETCYRLVNNERIKKNQKRSRDKNKGRYKDYRSAYAKKYALENKEKLKAYKAAYYQKNKERLDALAKKRKNEKNNS